MLGKFRAKVKEIGIGKTQGGAPQIVANIAYIVEEEGQEDKVLEKTWFGNLGAGQAGEITLKSLLVMGYVLKASCPNLEDLANGSGIDTNKVFEVVITENEWQGKRTERITGIYEEGSSGFSKLASEEAVSLLKSSDVGGVVMAFMQDRGIMPEKAPAKESAAKPAKKPIF